MKFVNPEKDHKSFFESTIFALKPIDKLTIKNYVIDEKLSKLKFEEDRYLSNGGFFCNASGYSFYPKKNGYQMFFNKSEVSIDKNWGIHVERCLAKQHLCNMLKIKYMNTALKDDVKDRLDRAILNKTNFTNIDWDSALKEINSNLRNLSVAPILIISTELSAVLASILGGLGLQSKNTQGSGALIPDKISKTIIFDDTISVTPMDLLIYMIIQSYFENFLRAKISIDKFMVENKYSFAPSKNYIGDDWVQNYTNDIKNTTLTTLPIIGASQGDDYEEGKVPEREDPPPLIDEGLSAELQQFGENNQFFLAERISSRVNMAINSILSIYPNLTPGRGSLGNIYRALYAMLNDPNRLSAQVADLTNELYKEADFNAAGRVEYRNREEFGMMINDLLNTQPNLFAHFNAFSFLYNIYLFESGSNLRNPSHIERIFHNLHNLIDIVDTKPISRRRFELPILYELFFGIYYTSVRDRTETSSMRNIFENRVGSFGSEGFSQGYTDLLNSMNGEIRDRIIYNRGGGDSNEGNIFSSLYHDRNTMSFGGMLRKIKISSGITRNRLYREIFWSGNTYVDLNIMSLPGAAGIREPHRFVDDLINWLWPRDYLMPIEGEEVKADFEEEKKENQNVSQINENQNVSQINEPIPEQLVAEDSGVGMNIVENIQNNPNIPPAVRSLLIPTNPQDLMAVGQALQAVANEMPPLERARIRLSTNRNSQLIESFLRDNVRHEGQDVAPIIRAQLLGTRIQDLMSSWVNRVVDYLERETPNIFQALTLFNYTLVFVAAFGNNVELRKKLLKALLALFSLLGFIVGGNIIIHLINKTGKSVEEKLKDIFNKIRGEDPEAEINIIDNRVDKTIDPVDFNVAENYAFMEILNKTF